LTPEGKPFYGGRYFGAIVGGFIGRMVGEGGKVSVLIRAIFDKFSSPYTGE